MIVYFAPVWYSIPSGICLTIAKNCILYVNNVTVPTRTRTHSRSTWPVNIHQLQHRPQKQVQPVTWMFALHDQVLYVVYATCTVKRKLVLRFILLLIKRHHVRSVHRNSTMLPAGTSTSTWSTMIGIIESLIEGFLQPAQRHSTTWRSWASTQGMCTGQHFHLDSVTKIVLSVSELLMVWSNMARLMTRSHGTTPTLQRTRRIGTSAPCVKKLLIYLPNC